MSRPALTRRDQELVLVEGRGRERDLLVGGADRTAVVGPQRVVDPPEGRIHRAEVLLVVGDGLLTRGRTFRHGRLGHVGTGRDVVQEPSDDLGAEHLVFRRVADELMPQVVDVREHAVAGLGVRGAECQETLQLTLVQVHLLRRKAVALGVRRLHVVQVEGHDTSHGFVERVHGLFGTHFSVSQL